MDIWLLAVLIAWLPVAAALALLLGRTVMTAERCERQLHLIHRLRPGHPSREVTIASVWRHPHSPRGQAHQSVGRTTTASCPECS